MYILNEVSDPYPDWKLESLANGKKISAVQFPTEKVDYL